MIHKKIITLLFVLFSFSFFAQEEIEIVSKPFVEFKSTNKFGFKQDGQVVIPAKFDYVTFFSEGFALVKENGKWGYIDSVGNWFIEAQFDKGQPFSAGKAFVNKDGKIGLLVLDVNEVFHDNIDENENPLGVVFIELELSWKYLLEPIYDNIKQVNSAYFLSQNGKWGYFYSEDESNSSLIPCLYDSINIGTSYHIVSCRNEDKTWNIYHNGKLIMEQIDAAVTYDSFDWDTGAYIVSKKGKYGIFSVEKGWIVNTEYASIERLNFPSYKIGKYEWNVIFALHEKSQNEIDPDYYNNVNSNDQITLVKANGKKISVKKFNAIKTLFDDYSEIPNPYALELYADGKLVHLNSNFTIKEYSFTDLTSHYYFSYYISNGGKQQYILDAKFNVLDSFFRIEKYQEVMGDMHLINEYEEDSIIIDPETGLEMFVMVDNISIVDELFLLVFRENNSKIEKAFYDLESRKLICPWFSEESDLRVLRTYFPYMKNGYEESAFPLYTFYLEGENRSKMAYFNQFMEKPSEMLYEAQDTMLSDKFHFVLRRFVGDKFYQDLFSLKNEKVTLISSNYEIMSSMEVIAPYNYEMDGNDIYYGGEDYISSAFQSKFLLLKKDFKNGLITPDGQLFEPIFDTITQNSSNASVVNVFLNEKMGFINLKNGNYIYPSYDSELAFSDVFKTLNKEIDYGLYTETLNEKEERYYISSNGKKFYNFGTAVFPRKVKGKYGLFAYKKDLKDVEAFEQVKPVYKFLENSFFENVYHAKGKKNKWGLINCIGDTLIDFSYSKIEALQGASSPFLFKVYKKRKVGLYDLNLGEVVQANFDEISKLESYDYYLDAYVTRKGNSYGLVDGSGKEILAPFFDEIKFDVINENYLVIATKANKKVACSTCLYKENFEPIYFDFIARNQAYIKKEDGFEVYNLFNNSLIETIKDNTLVEFGTDYTIFTENGKFGVKDLEGNITIPAEFQSLEFNGGLDSDTFVGVLNGVKYYVSAQTGLRYTEDQW